MIMDFEFGERADGTAGEGFGAFVFGSLTINSNGESGRCRIRVPPSGVAVFESGTNRTELINRFITVVSSPRDAEDST